MNLHKIETITPTEYSRYRYIEKMLDRASISNDELCDIGCGIGNHLLVFEDHFRRMKGIDISDESLKLARERIRAKHIVLEKCDAFDLKERSGFILLTDVLEHVRDDRKLLKFIHDKIIKKDGYIVISVPAHSWLYSKFDKNAGHYRRYDKEKIRSLLTECGFSPVIFWCYGWLLFHYIANAMLIFEKKDKDPTADAGDAYLNGRTRISAVRNFSGISRLIISRPNIMHYICFLTDYIFRKCNFGIAYFILCKPS